jgi:hypothetical protein
MKLARCDAWHLPSTNWLMLLKIRGLPAQTSFLQPMTLTRTVLLNGFEADNGSVGSGKNGQLMQLDGAA